MTHKTSFWHFCQSGTLPGSVNMKVSRNIWNRNTFWIACMHCESMGSFKDESCTIGYIPQLSWNWRAPNRAGFFNGFELFVKLEIFTISFGSQSYFCLSGCIEINIRLRGRNLYVFQSPTVQLKLEMWKIDFTVFLNVHEKITFKNYPFWYPRPFLLAVCLHTDSP